MSLLGLFGFILGLLYRFDFVHVRLPEDHQKQVAVVQSVRARLVTSENLFEYGYQDEDTVNGKLAAEGLSCRDFEDQIYDRKVPLKVLWELFKKYFDLVIVDEMSHLERRPVRVVSELTGKVTVPVRHNSTKSDVQIAGRSKSEKGKRVCVLQDQNSDATFGFDSAGHCRIGNIHFMIVADGVGKREFTDLVSRVAVQFAIYTFKQFPEMPLQVYYENLIIHIQNFLFLCRLTEATTLVMARIDHSSAEIVSVGDSSALVHLRDGRVMETCKGQYSFNKPFCLCGKHPVESENIYYHNIDVEKVHRLILCTDGVTDNLWPEEIVQLASAEAIASAAVRVFETNIVPTPFKEGKPKRDDVSVIDLTV